MWTVRWAGLCLLMFAAALCACQKGSEPKAGAKQDTTASSATATSAEPRQEARAEADGTSEPIGAGREPTADAAAAAPSAGTTGEPAPGEASPDGVALEAAPPSEAEPARHAGLDEGALRALLDTWLAAQNEADFQSYSALYGTRFFGIKRSGPRTYRFDRVGWLADRRRMFKKGVQVQAQDVQIATAAASAVITFTQRWSSGKYEDVGPKQLVIVQEAGPNPALRISREEMLASTVVRGEQGSGGDSAAMLVVDRTYVVLSTRVDDDWVDTGKVELLDRQIAVRLRAPVAPGRVPAQLAALQGAELSVWGADGEVCRATVGDLYVLTRFEPHFGMVQSWEGTFDDGAPATEAQIAADAWSIGSEARLLVATLQTATACDGAMWARPVAGPAPVVYRPVKGDADFEAAALSQLRAMPDYAAIEREYAGWDGEALTANAARWEEYDGASPQVAVFEGPDGKRIVGVLAQSGYGCGGWWGQLWGVWQATPAEAGWTWKALSPSTEWWGFLPDAVFDADGDGALEMLGRDALVHVRDGVLEQLGDGSIPSYDCPC